VPAGIPLDEWAVKLSTAAEFVGVTTQALWKMTELKTLPAFIGPDGVRYVRLVDLAESPAGSRQASKDAELERRIADHDFRRDTYPAAGCEGDWSTCVQCGPPADEWEKPVPAKSKRPWPDPDGSRREQLKRAREVKASGDVKRRAERATKVATREA